MGFFQDVFGGFKTKLRDRAQLQQNAQQSRGRFGGILDSLMNRGQDLLNQPTLTAQDLFGEEIQRLSDQARAGANQTKSALSRAMLTNSGDTTGAGAINLLRTDQSLNQSLGNITNKFNTLATQISERRQNRGANFLSQALQGRQNLFATDQSLLSELINQEIQKEQAQKQKNAGVFGSILSLGGSIAGALCWVAEELYLEEDPEKVEEIRSYLVDNLDEENIVGEFARDYRFNGDDWAYIIKYHPEVRKSAKRLFDEIHELSKAA